MLEPVTLENDFVALEPLTFDHVAGLEQAAADGELWNLRVTYVPPPGAMRAYVEKALAMQANGDSLPLAVRDKRDGVLRQHKLRHDGTIRDSVEYSVIAAEWPTMRDRLRSKLVR